MHSLDQGKPWFYFGSAHLHEDPLHDQRIVHELRRGPNLVVNDMVLAAPIASRQPAQRRRADRRHSCGGWQAGEQAMAAEVLSMGMMDILRRANPAPQERGFVYPAPEGQDQLA